MTRQNEFDPEKRTSPSDALPSDLLRRSDSKHLHVRQKTRSSLFGVLLFLGGAVAGAVGGFAAGVGVNVKEVAKEYIEESDGDWRVLAALKVLYEINDNCAESREATEAVLKELKASSEDVSSK